ncbi:MAG: 4Fe-4S binding protein [Clostridia bacterium]|nr:4Fe-4S binding protein [Clostridia bacterium]
MANCLTLKKSNCKSCFRCVRKCPIKAIRFSGNQAHIISNECILCGNCLVQCPQNAKQIVDGTEKVKVLIQSGAPVVVSLAPSFVANYEGAGIGAMQEALVKLGFHSVEETALGATVVKNEYQRMLREDNRDVIISSCCHSVNLLVQKKFPALIPLLADVMSPMQAHCAGIKSRIEGAKTVFIGPCVAKKDEAEQYVGTVDAVLTFEELDTMLAEAGIKIERRCDSNDESRARLFPTTGGVLNTMTERMPEYSYLAVDGVENCIAALRDIEAGKVHKCFIEMSACIGSCIGGPVMSKDAHSIVGDYMRINSFAGRDDFVVEQPTPAELSKSFIHIEQDLQMPSELEIMAELRKMGKFRPSDELNCGTCGYNTCRDKAIAICQGKAEITMCLPFLKEKAESFSDTIVSHSPNGIIALNEDLEVQQINDAARKIMNIRSATDVLGESVVRILDPAIFLQVKNSGRSANDKVYLAEYKRFVNRTVAYDKDSRTIIAIMRDVTDEELERERKEDVSRRTAEVADRVVEKQMRIVQEIASLLGETAAETKIALTKLKENIADE